MKNDIKKYLTLGAVLAGSAFMVSCDGDDVTVVQDTGVADAITELDGDLGTKPVAPIKLAEFPLTSLKLTFDNEAGTCLGQTFEPGTELELDFDSTDITSADDINANGLADLAVDGGVIFAITGTNEGYVENITADPAASTWTIQTIRRGTDATGEILISDITLTPFGSDLRSVTGRFAGVAPQDVFVNQDTENVVSDAEAAPNAVVGQPLFNNLILPNGTGTAGVTNVTFYEDAPGSPAEITNNDASVVYESSIGANNLILSVQTNDDCVLNFAISRANYLAVNGGSGIPAIEAATAYNALNAQGLFQIIADVSDPAVNDIGVVTVNCYLTAGNSGIGITGSYRHDYDSSVGTPETIINSENEQ